MVQVNSSGALKINGERPLQGERVAIMSRFYKEIRVPEGCNIADIKARLYDGKLSIEMPRKSLNLVPRGDEVKCGIDEEMTGFGRFKVAKGTALTVGIAVVAIAAIGTLAIFKPQTPPPSSANLGE